jgi:hypothetical protein
VDPQALGRLLEVLHRCSVWDFSSMIGMGWVALRASGGIWPFLPPQIDFINLEKNADASTVFALLATIKIHLP